MTVAVCVVFASTVAFRITATKMGGLPVAEHHSLYPGNARTTGSCNTTLGGTVKRTNTFILMTGP